MKTIKKGMLLIIMCVAMISCSSEDESVVISTSDVTFSIDENSEDGTTIGTVTGSSSTGNTVAFSFSEESHFGALQINAATGVITVFNDDYFDYETNPTITASVKVADGSVSDISEVTVNLNNLEEGKVLVVK